MTAAIRVSVCLATYQGARWVEEQLVSVLRELGPNDEVVVVDDASRDDTVASTFRKARQIADQHGSSLFSDGEESRPV